MFDPVKKIYNKIYSHSPKSVKGVLSKVVFETSGKPFVKINSDGKKFSGGCKGGFVMSADFELAWAWRYTKTNKEPLKHAIRKAKQERENVPVFVKLFEEYNIPITWATVGHLFLERCKKEDHAWMRRIPHFDNHWLFDNGDWYDHDPCSDYKKAPEWYAPDLIELIINSKAGHEIGSHSFSHLHFKDSVCPPEAADDDIKACIDAARSWDIKLKSMVFPGGTNGNYKSLAKNGFTNYRQNLKYDLFYPETGEERLIRLPSSFSIEDTGFSWSKEYYLFRYKKYIDRAIETGTVCHAWFHPSESPWIVHEVFPSLLKYASDQREKGNLFIGTMEQFQQITKM